MMFKIRANDAYGISFGNGFVPMGVAIPTMTVLNKYVTIGFMYDSVSDNWGCIAAITET